ncbi:MAG: hypothetical protein LBE67_12450 [Kocuria palustris]|jgi:hypothetical protein|uniref:hypothetical protein n=1 Tax=Kocuria palustris TaxID=71999 RepID=UPI001D800F0B|nr:hypothetical protein [Kocuria palustris]MBZ6375775.1 hypothetical protein [Kocuria palustris]
MPHRIIKSVDGKRGDFLLAGGAAFAAIGTSYVTVRTQGRESAFSWLPGALGPNELGWIWVVGGVFCIAVALVSKRAHRLTAIAYAALMAPPMLWAIVFIGSWLTGAHPLGWVSAISYSLMSLWVWIASDWPNPKGQRDEPATGSQRTVETGGNRE